MWPSSYVLQRIPSAKYLASCSFGWSILSLLIPACRNFAHLMILRFLMGVAHVFSFASCRIWDYILTDFISRLSGRHYSPIHLSGYRRFLQKSRTTTSQCRRVCCHQFRYQRFSVLGCRANPGVGASGEMAVFVSYHRSVFFPCLSLRWRSTRSMSWEATVAHEQDQFLSHGRSSPSCTFQIRQWTLGF